MFVATRGAGPMQDGPPYVAKFADTLGNVCTRNVPRPYLISRYYRHSNAIDLHNQSRQHDLALEECWPTTSGFERLSMTLVGMTVTDAWYAVRFDENHTAFRKRQKTCKRMRDFVSQLAQELLWPNGVPRALLQPISLLPAAQEKQTKGIATPVLTAMRKHPLVKRQPVVNGARVYKVLCTVCGRARATIFQCGTCQKAICLPPNTCWGQHIDGNGSVDNRKRRHSNSLTVDPNYAGSSGGGGSDAPPPNKKK